MYSTLHSLNTKAILKKFFFKLTDFQIEITWFCDEMLVHESHKIFEDRVYNVCILKEKNLKRICLLYNGQNPDTTIYY